MRSAVAAVAVALATQIGCESSPPRQEATPPSRGAAPEHPEAPRRDPRAFFAHRGLSRLAPENTELAVRLAAERGFENVEIDVRTTRDDDIVVFHDEGIRRFTGAARLVCTVPTAELLAIDPAPFYLREILGLSPGAVSAILSVGDPWVTEIQQTGFLTLDQMFATFGARLVYHLDVKRLGCETPRPIMLQRLVELVERHELEERVYVESTALEDLALVRAMNPRVKTMLWRDGIFNESDDHLALVRKVGIAAVDLASGGVDPARRDRLAGFTIHTFTVNSVPEIDRLLPVVDYILTDLDVASGELRSAHDFFNERAQRVQVRLGRLADDDVPAGWRAVGAGPVTVLVQVVGS